MHCWDAHQNHEIKAHILNTFEIDCSYTKLCLARRGTKSKSFACHPVSLFGTQLKSFALGNLKFIFCVCRVLCGFCAWKRPTTELTALGCNSLHQWRGVFSWRCTVNGGIRTLFDGWWNSDPWKSGNHRIKFVDWGAGKGQRPQLLFNLKSLELQIHFAGVSKCFFHKSLSVCRHNIPIFQAQLASVCKR